MSSRLTEVIIDCADLRRMVQFWSDALGYEEANRGEGWVALRAPGQQLTDEALRLAPQLPAIALVVVPEGKSAKNRVHLDITPFDTTQLEEVRRLERLGARQADIGQKDTPWIVMADPEGNEFCVMPELDRND
jgi:catechol 2,3-dioxygenase-like lactoylglutathione lyase family enzyme